MPDKLPFAQIDAFASRPFEGNPAAVIPLEDWLADDVLQAIAEENNLAETAFFIPSGAADADYDLRWFTPAIEVDLCGHATLASGHYLLSQGPERTRIRFRTRLAGVLEVRRATSGYELDLPARRPLPAEADPRVVKAIGLQPEAVLSYPGGNWLYVVTDAAAVRAMTPNFGLLREVGNHLVVVTAPGDAGPDTGHDTGHDVVSRVFAAGAGIDEDPVTGAAHAMLTPYWAERLGRASFGALQASPRGGRVECRLAGDRAVLGGTCVTVIEGMFTL